MEFVTSSPESRMKEGPSTSHQNARYCWKNILTNDDLKNWWNQQIAPYWPTLQWNSIFWEDLHLPSILKMSSIIQLSLMVLTDVCFPYSDAAKTWLFLPHNGLQPYWYTASGGCEKPLQPNAAILKPSHENDLLKAAFSSGTKTGFFALHTALPRPEDYSCLS